MKRTTRRAGSSVRWTMIAVAAAVLVAVPVVAQIQFSDVPDDNPHRRDINYVAGERWFLGFRDGTYKPDQNITPAQMTRVLTRTFVNGITRAEFASFMVAGNTWQQRVKEVPGYVNREFNNTNQLLIVGEDIAPGRYRISSNSYYRTGCRWMRLGYIPDGGQNFDTIAATDAPIAGYFQGEYTQEPHIIRIEPTDIAFMTECGG